MIVLDIISLKYIWDFLKPIFSGAITERLKPKNSTETAKRKVFYLYTMLGEVSQKTDDYVINLQSYLELVEKNASKAEIHEKDGRIRNAAFNLMESLPKLTDALAAINPQLEIYQQKLVQEIDVYYNFRRMVQSELDFLKVSGVNKRNLKQLVTQAQENRKLIHKAIEDLRSFIAQEFSFKESF